MVPVSKIISLKSKEHVNRHLLEGWELLAVYTRLFDGPNEPPRVGDEYPVFVLGWPRSEKGTPEHPKGLSPDGIDAD